MQKSQSRAAKDEAEGVQNRGPGLPKCAPGPLKWHQVGPKSIINVAWRLLSTPREPSRALGSGLGAPRAAKMGAKRLQDTPKSSQNGANMESKWGLKPVQHGIRFRMLKNIDFSLNFRSIFYKNIESEFNTFCKDLVLGLTSSKKGNLHETPLKPMRNQLF